MLEYLCAGQLALGVLATLSRLQQLKHMNILEKIIILAYSFILAVIPTPRYVEGVTGQPQNFLPSQATTSNDQTISRLLFRSLYKYNINGELVPDLADTVAYSGDGLVYTVKLKPNQKWINGRNINSDDLIYTAFKSPDLSGVGTDKIDDLTIRYTLPNKYAPFQNLLTLGVLPINSLENSDHLFPLTSGDFRIGRIKRSGARITEVMLVTTNPAFDIKKIIFRYYSNQEELVSAAKLGEISAFLADKEEKLDNFDDHKFPLQGIYYGVFFNLRNPKFQDQLKRQKLVKALPVDKITFDKGITVEGPISRSLFTNKALTFNTYDEKFKEDMSDMPFILTIPDLPNHWDIARRIRQNWRESLGFNIEIRAVDPADFVKRVIEPRNFEAVLYGEEVGRDPDRYVWWHSTQKASPGLNITGFEQVRADRALEEGRNQLDNSARVVHYNEFQKTLLDQAPAIFLYHPYTHYYVNKYIEGEGDKYTFTAYDRFLDFANWKQIRTN